MNVKEIGLRGVLRGCLSSAALAVVVLSGANSASASMILCPNQALEGGFGNSFTSYSGSQDSTCGANSGVTLNLTADTNYAKLMWNTSTDPNGPSTQALPDGLTLATLPSADASVSFTAGQAGVSPYFMVSFADPGDSVGQANAGDQILLIEFEDLGINGVGSTTMTLDPNATLFNLYDNTTGHYLEGGQQVTNTLNGWLAADSSLATDSVNGIWLAEGLGGGCSGACSETLSVDSVTLNYSATPEPGTIALMFTGLGVLAGWRRKIAK